MQLLLLLVAFAAVAAATPLVRRAALRLQVVDKPKEPRKTHGRIVPLLGGVAVYAGILAAVAAAMAMGVLPGEHIKSKHLIGILAAGFLLILGGALDDAWNLPPRKQIVWPLLAALAVIASGIGITYVTNPFGGQLHLDRIVVPVLEWRGIPYKVTLLADLFSLVWLMGMTYTTKLLDGLDGLVSGLMVIGALIIAAVSLMKEVSQPDTAVLALIVAGAFGAFLLFNFHPAKIFLGEGGSTLAGFLLGTLSIVSGGKIATALLVLGLPIFDAALVVLRRLRERRSPVAGDRSHLHFRLLDLGLTQRQVVLFYYLAAALFGTSTLILRGWEKLVAILALVCLLTVATAVALAARARKTRT